jgi:trk system potassium uptake protein TrkH
MSIFDSICHSFTALSTGGFSPYDGSIGFYQASGHANYALIEYILILGMILGGTNFLIHYRVLKGDVKALGDNSEMRHWWGFILAFVIFIFAERVIKIFPLPQLTENPLAFWQQLESNFRAVFFQTTAILTTTGFATEDIGSPAFGFLAKQLFLVMMIIGGCVGSTGGGIKVFRVSVLLKVIKREVFRLSIPRRALSPLVIDGKIIPPGEIVKICGIFIAWIAIIIIGGCITALLSAHDAVSSFSGMCSALGNIGPCYIPAQEMSQLHPLIKIVYIFGMLAGRLEILPVLLLFRRRSWM